MFYYNNQITMGASRQERLGSKVIDGSTCSITEEVQFSGKDNEDNYSVG